MNTSKEFWKSCLTCGRNIPFQAPYYLCSVSTCNKKSNPKIYCSVDCWEIHVPVMNHKGAWAEEEYAPRKSEYFASVEDTPGRKIITANSSSPSSSPSRPLSPAADREILIVASKLKAYIKERADLNMAANCLDKLSDLVRNLTDAAILKARQDGRKTLMDRDFE